MSSEFLAANSQHSVRLKSLRNDEIALKTSIIKFKKIEQAEISELACVWIHYSLPMQGWIWSLKTTYGFNFQMKDLPVESFAVRLIWLDCNTCHKVDERTGCIYQSESLGNPVVYGSSTLPTLTSLGCALAFVYFLFSHSHPSLLRSIYPRGVNIHTNAQGSLCEQASSFAFTLSFLCNDKIE